MTPFYAASLPLATSFEVLSAAANVLARWCRLMMMYPRKIESITTWFALMVLLF
jgi:hypothetical protein